MKAIKQVGLYVLSALLVTGILINNAAAEESVIVENFEANSLRFDDIKMNLEIKIHTSNNIEVKIFNPDTKEKLVNLKTSGDELVINQLKTASSGDISVFSYGADNGGGHSVVTIGNKTTIVEGNNIIVTHGSLQNGSKARPGIVVSIPVGTPITLNNFKGKATIGDTKSEFNMNGSGKIVAGDLNKVKLELSQNSKVKINRVKQLLEVKASGNSKLQLQHGSVENLQINLTGNSRVKYGGHAKNASVSVTDNGKLFIASVDKRQKTKVSGNGRLTIGNW